MAIVKMKRLRMVAMVRDREELLRRLQHKSEAKRS